ncbi:hypothetical protein WJX72_003788 [[Myrmecia] bisecta]|uniref:Uncharacterized protein n=1 Tax=[Myrmecia] bisecta TaxID=41462 RepID=A0AAW1Q8L1_9CHLO
MQHSTTQHAVMTRWLVQQQKTPSPRLSVYPGKASHRCRGLCTRLAAEPAEHSGPTPSTSQATDGDIQDNPQELLIERQLKGRRKKPQGPKVIAPAVERAYGGGPQTGSAQLEALALQGLAVLFCIILGLGIFLAASGFLPETWDQFAQDYVYKSFTPVVFLFLTCSSIYGIWKSRQGPM